MSIERVVRFVRRRAMRLLLVALWLIDVSTSATWIADATLTNSWWSWPATRVYHIALYLATAIALLLPEE
jgi:hypothetical protein